MDQAGHRRAQGRPAGASALGQVRGQRRLARPGRDRVQPRPSRRDRSRDPEGPLGDSAPTDHRHPRPDRDHQPPSRPAPTRLLALGIGVEPAVGQHDRTASLRRLLGTQPAPARPEDPMESVRSGYRRPPENPVKIKSSSQAIRRSAPVDPGSEHGQFGYQRK